LNVFSLKNRKLGSSSIASEQIFHANFNHFTNNVFQGVNWSNLFTAGGAVLGPLLTGKDN
jgi:hypothetical protein